MKLYSGVIALVLSVGATGIPCWSQTPTYAFGFNAAGQAVTVDGVPLMSWNAALQAGVRLTGAATYSGSALTWSPPADAATSEMLRSVLYSGNGYNLQIPLTVGSYQVYLWTLENHQNHYRSMNVRLQGVQVAASVGDLLRGEWRKYGPYPATVLNGQLAMDIVPLKGEALLAGVAIYRAAAGGGGNLPPVVSLTSPAVGAGFLAPATIQLAATAIDPDGSIARVEYFDGSTLIGQSTTTPYSVTWSGAGLGPHTITAKAWDNGGASGVSAPVAITVSAPTQASDLGPLRVSADGRYFLKPNGDPFFFMADTGWPMLTQYGCETAERYIDKRASQGFNVILTVIAWSDVPPLQYAPLPDCQGHPPFLNDSPAQPNEAFFQRLDYLLQYAGQRGITLGILPMWGNTHAVFEQRFFKFANMRPYGRYLGERYKNVPNLFWVPGGDIPAAGGQTAMFRELAEGLRERDPNHLITYHPDFGNSGGIWFHNDSWFGFDMFQAWSWIERIPTLTATSRARNPPKPVVMSEGAYEDGQPPYWYPISPVHPPQIRKQAYWSLLSGCAGTTYGHIQTWTMDGDWLNRWETDGARQMTIYRNAFEPHQWWLLVPDQTLIVSGATGGMGYNAAARTSNGTEFFVYIVNPQSIGVDMSRITAFANANVVWLDPRNGQTQNVGTFPASGTRVFTVPAGWEDSLLMVLGTGTNVGDNVPPQVSVTAPAPNASLQGTATATASATDNIGVVGVTFYLNNTALGTEVTSAPYQRSFDTSPFANGNYSLKAVARDASGNMGTSALVPVQIANSVVPPTDNVPPQISVIAPASGATLQGTVTVIASASDNTGVAGVAFYLNDALLGTEVTAVPYQRSFNTATYANGSYSLKAVARDLAGNTATSALVPVTISNAVVPPADTVPPQVGITAPGSGAVLAGTATVAASATDNTAVQGVTFYLNDIALGTQVTTAPYQRNFDTSLYANGAYSLKAVARDLAGNTATSGLVPVQISNATTSPVPGVVRAINLGGAAVTVDGVAMSSWAQAQASGATSDGGVYSGSYGFALNPAAGTDTRSMLQSMIWGPGRDVRLNVPIANGSYQVYLWMVENHATGYRESNLLLQNQPAAAGLGRLPLGHWRRYGPYPVAVANGQLQVMLQRVAGDPLLNAIAILTSNATLPSSDTVPPQVSLTAPASGTTLQGTALATATATDDTAVAGVTFYLNDTALGAEVTVAPYQRSFDTTAFANAAYTLKAVARDSAGNTATSNLASVQISNTAVPPGGSVVKAINFGGAAVTVDGIAMTGWPQALASGVTTDGQSFSTRYGFILNPAADANTRTMLESLIWMPARDLNVNVPIANGSYQVYVWMMENNFTRYREVNLRLQNQTAATGLGRLPLGDWRKYGPYPVSVQNGVLQVQLQRVAGDPKLNGIAIVSAPQP